MVDVRPSRDGDQFHYHWAARLCLQLLPGPSDLAAVTVEGPSTAEGAPISPGEEVIDVGLYFGDERRSRAREVRYVQLKHSTRDPVVPWTASGLKTTIHGFAARYLQLCDESSEADVAARFRFAFTTNRPIDAKVEEALSDLRSGASSRHTDVEQKLREYTELDDERAAQFFSLFIVEGGEDDLWAQRNLLTHEISRYLPNADADAPVQLKELVTRKATTEFERNPSICRHDVLLALKVSEADLWPAECLVPPSAQTLPREQEASILKELLASPHPLVIHAEGGVGKSVLARRIVDAIPAGSAAVLYDCFGDGLYRNTLHFRHRHRDAFVQIANELAARGLCHPLIPSVHADSKLYMRAFVGRLDQASKSLRAKRSDAFLCLVIDAADNAELVANEQAEPGSFVRDLLTAPLPEGVRLALTCRTHRRGLLRAPPSVREIELGPFTLSESGRHLRSVHAAATDAEVAEFAALTNANPRVQALVLSRNLPLPETLRQLGPEPSTVEGAIAELLDNAVRRLRDQAGAEAAQVDVICEALAVLRPFVPIAVLAQLSGISESAVRTFALELGRPLLLKGNSLHFLDEPTETWFRESFHPSPEAITTFLNRLRPLTAVDSYAASALPQLLLQAGRLDELVSLALSGEALPTENALERRDVELQRLTFALKACLQQGQHLAAAKLALRAGGESAGEERQNRLIQANTDIASVLMGPERVLEIASRGCFRATWMGSQHAYCAGLLSGHPEHLAEASSRLRMAHDWLYAWARRPRDPYQQERVETADIAEMALARLRLRGSASAAHFLRGWTPRHLALTAGRQLGRRLLDLGDYEGFNLLAEAAGSDLWLALGLATEARSVGRQVPAGALSRWLRLLGDRRVQLKETDSWADEWSVLDGVRAVIELAYRVLPPKPDLWKEILRRYLPAAPPRRFTSPVGNERVLLLRAYALGAALSGQQLKLVDVAPPEIHKYVAEPKEHGTNQEVEDFQRGVAPILPWFVLSAEVTCGRTPSDCP